MSRPLTDRYIQAKRIALGHFAARGSGAVLMALVVRFVPLPLELLGNPPHLVANLHLLLNGINLIVALPFCARVERLMARYVAAPAQPEERPEPVSAQAQRGECTFAISRPGAAGPPRS